MLTLDANTVAQNLPYNQLIDALDTAFRSSVDVPHRAHHEVPVADGTPGTLLLMPAWQAGGGLGVKIATVFPDNSQHGYPSVFASYLLMSAETGIPIAVLDGTELTLRRTAAASALASSYLSCKKSTRLLMVGTGNLAPHLIAAHASARPISSVCIWGRRAEEASRIARSLSSSDFEVSVSDNLQTSVEAADIISCATLATEPLIKGEWLKPGQHVDLVGAFKPEMREADEEALRVAEVFVDTLAGALSEAGEIVQSIQSESITEKDIKGELSSLAGHTVKGRVSDDAITLFKSVGTALEDLAAAELAIRNFQSSQTDT